MTVERLARVARAAGCAMATHEDTYDNLGRQPAPHHETSPWRTWSANSTERQIALAPPQQSRLSSLRDMLASLWFRQPA